MFNEKEMFNLSKVKYMQIFETGISQHHNM